MLKDHFFFQFNILGLKTGVRDQPLTFHSKVKSSGYTAATPRHVLFCFVCMIIL